MIHNKLYTIYSELLPSYAKLTTEWFPNGGNSIRVRVCSKGNYILTYKSDRDWKFETEASFLNKK